MSIPYTLSEKDDYSFDFTTIRGIKYKIYFLDYSFMFEDYPDIDCPIYSLNIEAVYGNPDDNLGDDRVGITVAKIINLFFAKVTNVAVYVCDSIDERQFARKRKFDLWFYLYNNGNIVKEDALTIIEGNEIYNSLLLHKQNPQLTKIILAFKELNERSTDK